MKSRKLLVKALVVAGLGGAVLLRPGAAQARSQICFEDCVQVCPGLGFCAVACNVPGMPDQCEMGGQPTPCPANQMWVKCELEI